MPPKPPENITLLLEVGRLLSSKLELADLLHTIMTLASQVVNAETASLLLVDAKTDELYFDVALGLDPELSRTRLKLGQGIAGLVAQSGKPLIINDVSKDPRWSSTMDQRSGFMTRSILAVPMLLKGKRIGVVEAINHRHGEFTPADLRAFEAFASQAAISIENARLFASLSEEKAKLNTLFSEMRDAAVLADSRGKILLANEAARKLFFVGRPAAADLREATKGLTATPPIEAILESAEDLVRFEVVREKPKQLVLAGTASLIQGSQGRVLVFRDVTEEKREEGLKRSFLSLISHKLKTPLASITGYSQLLQEEFSANGAPEMHRKALSTIKDQGQKLADLVEKLLNYTVLEDIEAAELENERFSVDDMLAEAVHSMESWLEERKARVELGAPCKLFTCGDSTLIRDVVKNLIENAVKFSAPARRQAKVWAAPEGDTVAIRVQDSGPGIPPEEQDKIFNKFYQIEASFTGQVEGWGLGLSFVQQVVRKHGGSVRLKSKLGLGSTFTVTLPLESPQ